MNVEFLMWHDITITHLNKNGKKDSSKKIDTVPCGAIRFGVDNPNVTSMQTLSIQGYDGVQGFSTDNTHTYINPMLVKMTSQLVEFEADWWSTKFHYKGKSLTPYRQTHKKHRVKICAKF